MGKAEIEMRIKMVEQLLAKYIELSEESVENEKKFKATIERFRQTLSSLYMEKESK